jgi:hypothetical protein
MTEPHVVPENLTDKPAYTLKRESKKPAHLKLSGGAEYRERVPRGFTSLGNGVVMRFLKPDEK